jgi:hypothetical protein
MMVQSLMKGAERGHRQRQICLVLLAKYIRTYSSSRLVHGRSNPFFPLRPSEITLGGCPSSATFACRWDRADCIPNAAF